MKKIEFIWRHLLYNTIEKRVTSYSQQDLASFFQISSSTVHLALKPLRALGAVRVGGRGFEVVDAEKMLYHWANHRRLEGDIRYKVHIRLPIREIEGLLPEGTIPTAYTAVNERVGEPPAEYDKIYCYHADPAVVIDRFQQDIIPGQPNMFMLESDPRIKDYGGRMTLGQLFVDLWGLSDWYAKDFGLVVKGLIDGLLS